MFNEDELCSIYNCLHFVIAEREMNNEITALFEEGKFVDPILDRLYSLEVKVLRELDKIRESENG